MGDEYGPVTEPEVTPETNVNDNQIVIQGETVVANKGTDDEKVFLLIDPTAQQYDVKVVDLENGLVDTFDKAPVTSIE